MPKVLIIGSTGYLGLTIAQHLRSTSTTVYGLLRTPSKASILTTNEITPVTGSVEDPASYLALIESANIDIVIDASATYDGAHAVLQSLIGAGKQRLAAAAAAVGKDKTIRTPKLGYIYISGMWIHGDSPTTPVNDLSPIGDPARSAAQPPAMLSWRPAVEREVLSATTAEALDVAIIRPALMYGRTQSAFGSYFGPILQAVGGGGGGGGREKLALPATREAMLSLVHVDDCAEGVARLAERLGTLGGTTYPVFDLVAHSENMGSILQGAARILGYGGELEFAGPGEDLLAQCMCATVRGNSSRARAVLGWVPHRRSLTDELEVHVGGFLGSLKGGR